MNKQVRGLALLSLVLMILVVSCRKFEECLPNVFMNEDLYLDVNMDGQNKYISDTVPNHIFPGQSYIGDSTRTDTIIFNFDTHYNFDGENGYVSITIVEYVDFSEVYDLGFGNLNFAKFDSLIVVGDYEYTARNSTAPIYGVNVTYTTENSLSYIIDTTAAHPEDFYFSVDSHIKSIDTDCYNRDFEWITYTGTFGCRLVEPLTFDTIVIREGEFRAVAAQYK